MNATSLKRCILLLAISGYTIAIADEPPAASDAKAPPPDTTIQLRVVDEAGKPVPGALAGLNASFYKGKWSLGLNDDGKLTDEDGRFTLSEGADFADRVGLVAWHKERNLVGVVIPSKPIDPNELQTVVVHPACRVTGKLVCPPLEAKGQKIGWIGVDAAFDGRDVFQLGTETDDYDFMLPPGEYQIETVGSQFLHVHTLIVVRPGEKELVVPPLAVQPSQLKLLEGEPAPALRGVVAWKGSKPLSLEKLRGKYIVLHFWGHWCGPCVARMPALFDLRQEIPADKLAIVGVHVGLDADANTDPVDTVEELDKALTSTRHELWKDRDLPFPVALVESNRTPHIGGEGEARSEAAADYGIIYYPTSLLIDPGGRVVGEANDLVEDAAGRKKLAAMIEAWGNR